MREPWETIGEGAGLGRAGEQAMAGKRSAPRPPPARDDLRLIALAAVAVMARGLLPDGRAGHLAAGGITLAAAATLLVMAVLAAADAAPVPPARGPGGATGRRPPAPFPGPATAPRRPRR